MTLSVSVSEVVSTSSKKALADLVESKFASRLFSKDFTLWGKAAEAESSIRLGWTSSATDSRPLVAAIEELRAELNAQGVTRVVLCGMGGSSLAPEVIVGSAGLELVVLDSTNPEQVGTALAGDLSKTVVVVSSKSGSTVETDSQKRLFEEAFTNAGIKKSERIVIVTDPGSPMEAAAKADGYRIFNADPTVGGRYSALTAFGLVPSGLAGVNIGLLLSEAEDVVGNLSKDSFQNPGLVLGAAMAHTIRGSKPADKLAIINKNSPLVGFADWAEQLIAESTGKDGKGVLPIALSGSAPELKAQPNDLLIVELVEQTSPPQSSDIQVSGNLGAQFLLWEVATAAASAILELNPFDQPDVESAKVAARAMLENRAPESEAIFTDSGIEVRVAGFDLAGASTLSEALKMTLAQLESDGYVSVQAYLDRENQPQYAALRDSFAKAADRPTTFGWAPRFLHSTGQYHKGGPAQGVYIQLVSRASKDITVPGRGFTLGELIASQAAGDAAVLAEHGRPVLTLTIADVSSGASIIEKALGY
jgi:glucose-6-phosphate isomerase